MNSKINLNERLQAAEEHKLCSIRSREQVILELCKMRLSDLFPDYYDTMFADESSEKRRRKRYKNLTFGKIAHEASSCDETHLYKISNLLDALILPFEVTLEIEKELNSGKRKTTTPIRSNLDYRFWNDVFFELNDPKKARGLYLTRMMTLEDYFDILLKMTFNNHTIERLRCEYLYEYSYPIEEYLYEDEFEEECEEECEDEFEEDCEMFHSFETLRTVSNVMQGDINGCAHRLAYDLFVIPMSLVYQYYIIGERPFEKE